LVRRSHESGFPDKKEHTNGPDHPRPRRVGRLIGTAIGALAITSGTLAITAGSASAWSLPQVCSAQPQANACLSGYTDDPYVQVHVGIDVWIVDGA
jgi:hypothetical protein